MMKTLNLLTTGTLVSTLILGGCSDDTEPTPTQASQVDDLHDHDHDHDGDHHHDHDDDASTLEHEATKATTSAQPAMNDSAAGIRNAADHVENEIATGVDSVKASTGLAKKPSEVDVEALDLSEGSSLNSTQATAVLDKIRSLISTQNLDLAEQWLEQLDDVTLPDGFDKYVADVRGLLDKARQGDGQLEGLMSK